MTSTPSDNDPAPYKRPLYSDLAKRFNQFFGLELPALLKERGIDPDEVHFRPIDEEPPPPPEF